MKRIYAVAMVKNESDVIESFCRHTLTFCDGILICDDDSTDGTREIIEKLAAEGLPVILFYNLHSIGYYQDLLINHLAKKAVDSHGADLVLPLDADEFLYSLNGENPRSTLESLSDSEVYRLNWPFFLPSDNPRKNSVFLPTYFEEYMNQSRLKKVMVGAALLRNPHNRISIGNQVLYKDDSQAFWDARLLDNLILAHYPVRSAEQIMTKAIVGWANALCTLTPGNVAGNWGTMYQQIKQYGFPNTVQLKEFAMTYRFGENLPVLPFSHQSDVTLRYTDYEKGQQNFLNIILTNYERIINTLMTRGSGYSLSESFREADIKPL